MSARAWDRRRAKARPRWVKGYYGKWHFHVGRPVTKSGRLPGFYWTLTHEPDNSMPKVVAVDSSWTQGPSKTVNDRQR